MRIVKVEAENLKGRSFAYDLSAEVAIVGDNFTGKTSIIDAIRLALIGYLPELGKLPKATRQLMSSDFMGVRVVFDNDAEASFEINDTQERELPVALDRNIPLLNAAAYFAMSERERYQYVFDIAKTPEAFTASAICEELRAIHFEQSGTDHAKKGMISYVADAFVSRTIQEGLQAAIDKLAELFKHWNARGKDTQGAVRILTELKNQQEAMAGNAKQFADNEALARELSQAAYKTVLELRSRKAAAFSQGERRKRMEELRKTTQSTEETEKLERLIEEATKQLKPKVESEYTEADVAMNRKIVSDDTAEFQEFSRKLIGAQQQLGAVRNLTECPYCGAKGTLEKLAAKLSAEIEFNEGAKAGSARRLEVAEGNLSKIEAEIKRVREDLAFNQRINTQIIGWQGRIDMLAKSRATWNRELDQEEKDLAAIAVEPVTKEELDAAEAENTKAEAAYKLARQKLKEAELLEQDIRRAAQSQLEHQNAIAHVTVIKAIGKVLREKQAELVNTVFSDLLKVANGIVGEIMASDLAFYEGEVGRWDGHRWISHRTFSGTEQALTFVAIAAALSQGAPIRLLIFDELGRLDTERRALLMNVLHRALQDGWIDQWIIAGTNDTLPETLAPDVQLVELT